MAQLRWHEIFPAHEVTGGGRSKNVMMYDRVNDVCVWTLQTVAGNMNLPKSYLTSVKPCSYTHQPSRGRILVFILSPPRPPPFLPQIMLVKIWWKCSTSSLFTLHQALTLQFAITLSLQSLYSTSHNSGRVDADSSSLLLIFKHLKFPVKTGLSPAWPVTCNGLMSSLNDTADGN